MRTQRVLDWVIGALCAAVVLGGWHELGHAASGEKSLYPSISRAIPLLPDEIRGTNVCFHIFMQGDAQAIANLRWDQNQSMADFQKIFDEQSATGRYSQDVMDFTHMLAEEAWAWPGDGNSWISWELSQCLQKGEHS